MLKNYFKTLFRNMQKNKLHTAINIIGMAVAFTCSILLLLFIYQQFSFDSFHTNKDRLFELYNSSNGPQGAEASSSMGYPVAPTIKSEGIGIEKATRFRNGGRRVRYKEKELDLQVKLVDNDFFSMFSFPVAEGNKVSPLSDLGDVVISEYAAKKLFGTKDPIGKSVEANIGGEWKVLVVSAVLKDFPNNSSITFDVLARPEISPDYAGDKDRWDNTHHPVFVQLSPNTTAVQVQRQLRNFTKKYYPNNDVFMKNKGYKPDENGDLFSLRLLPLTDLHFDTKVNGGGAMTRSLLYVILLVSFVIILIACFNFINLNIGLSFTRTKEMGIRKCLGAGKRQVWLQIWGESLFTVLMAMFLAIASIVLLLKYVEKNSLSKLEVSLFYQPFVVFILFFILIAVSFIASGYPAFIMGKLKTVEILKGKISLKKPGVLRNALIVVQFVIACVLICSTFIIYKQFQHLRNAPLGYNTASVISIPIHNPAEGRKIVSEMRTLLSSQTSIVSVTGSSINLGVGADRSTSKIGLGFDYNGRSVRTNLMPADYDILKTLNIAPKEGRDFTTKYTTDSSNAVIVTESMAKQLADQSVVGLSVLYDSTQPKWNIIGVIPDFHLYSLNEKNEALTISMSGNTLSYILIRVNTQNAASTMDLVKAAYAKAEPGVEFKGSYVNENVERWYANEQMLSKMFSIAALVAIVLSCMGLFGIAFIVIKQRVKEIGVRKVLGASVGNVAVLVTKEFIKPVLLAMVIATPIAWWAMNKWLQGFEYRINIQWTIFLAAGFVAVFIAVATVASQAIKAAIANPVKSLRSE